MYVGAGAVNGCPAGVVGRARNKSHDRRGTEAEEDAPAHVAGRMGLPMGRGVRQQAGRAVDWALHVPASGLPVTPSNGVGKRRIAATHDCTRHALPLWPRRPLPKHTTPEFSQCQPGHAESNIPSPSLCVPLPSTSTLLLAAAERDTSLHSLDHSHGHSLPGVGLLIPLVYPDVCLRAYHFATPPSTTAAAPAAGDAAFWPAGLDAVALMDLTYSSPCDAARPVHLSPTHLHRSGPLTTIRNIRRSMSRSPSKRPLVAHPTRSLTPSPQTPSPVCFASPLSHTQTLHATDDMDSQPSSTSVRRSRPALRRSAPLRLLSGSRSASPRSPARRALSDSSDQGNGSPGSVETAADGQENTSHFGHDKRTNSNTTTPPKWHPADSNALPPLQIPLFESALPAGPYAAAGITARSRSHRASLRSGLAIKSSPLKRSDGFMNLDHAQTGSPSAKRRSVHGGIASSPFAIATRYPSSDSSESDDAEDVQDAFFRKPAAPVDHPRSMNLSRASSLRANTSARRIDRLESHLFRRSVEFASDTTGAPPMIVRPSMDTALPAHHAGAPEPARRLPRHPSVSNNFEDFLRGVRTRNLPHPLSQAISPTSPPSTSAGSSSISDTVLPDSDSPINFSKSLPIGAIRPKPREHAARRGPSQLSTLHTASIGTPETYKIARPDPAAFRSTGLISKRFRDPDEMPPPPATHLRMPDTPCKGFPGDDALPHSPTPANSAVKSKFAQPHFGRPFPLPDSGLPRPSPQALEHSTSIFQRSLQHSPLVRQDSLASIEDDDFVPPPSAQGDSQSSNDELPPTPTKPNNHMTFFKSNSLRSSLFGRRTSLGPNTFLAPSDSGNDSQPARKSSPPRSTAMSGESVACLPVLRSTLSVPLDQQLKSPLPSFALSRSRRQSHGEGRPMSLSHKAVKLSFLSSSESHFAKPSSTAMEATHPLSIGVSPHTPAEAFIPDPSGLSISPHIQTPQSPINPSASVIWGRPPETPTTNRDSIFPPLERRIVTPNHHAAAQDVDPCLLGRFKKVEWYSRGEFSEVYRVYQSASPDRMSPQFYFSPSLGSKVASTPLPDRVWIVKKSKAPFHSLKLRQRALKEVQIMKELGKSDHVVHLTDSWEYHQHLYIQTEYCEEGNLHGFLERTGRKGRLDDFRIWKILIELSQGVKHIHDSGFIHLDLKPANIFIDFEGVLKIGDFGLASEWPAPPHAEGEGDRRYMGPDLLQGNFDKPADIFALGMIMFEIAGNFVLPDNGASWHQLRSGDWSHLPSLTSGSTHSVLGDDSHSLERLPDAKSYDMIYQDNDHDLTPTAHSHSKDMMQTGGHDPWQGQMQSTRSQAAIRSHFRNAADEAEPVQAPRFMLDPEDPEALDGVVKWMMLPDPLERPVIDQVLATGGVQWVNERRRAGAVVYEGPWGPPVEADVEVDIEGIEHGDPMHERYDCHAVDQGVDADSEMVDVL